MAAEAARKIIRRAVAVEAVRTQALAYPAEVLTGYTLTD